MPENKQPFYLQGTDKSKEGFQSARQVGFEWNMLYACNYRCPHCIFEGKWEDYGKRTVYLPVDVWMVHWRSIHERYGSCSLIISGGEPFMYPNFVDLIAEVSALHHPVNISTNSSGDLRRFVERVDPSKVSLNLSFQPGFNRIEEVLERNRFLKDHGFSTAYINLCAYPPYLKDLSSFVDKANAAGEVLKIIPFYGTYAGASYPDGYTADEKKLLGMNEAWESNVRRKGTRCMAGYRSALIFPDGKVARCGQIGERYLLGNIFSGGFSLLDAPMVCDVDLCPCLEAPAEDNAQTGSSK